MLWQPIPVSLPRESHGRRSLVGYSPRSRQGSDTTEWLNFSSSSSQTFPFHKKVCGKDGDLKQLFTGFLRSFCSLPSEVAELLFGRSVAQSSDSLRPHGLQHIRFLCPSSSPGAYSSSRPLSRWCHPTISSSVVPFSSSRQSFPASGSFPMSWLFASGSQNIGASASASIFLWVVEYRPIFFCFFLLAFTVRPRRASACWNLRSKSLDVFSGSKLSHFSWNNVHVSETQSPPFQRQNNRSLKQGFMLAQVTKLKLVQGQEHPHLYREIWAPGVQERRHNFKSVLKISPVTKIVT